MQVIFDIEKRVYDSSEGFNLAVENVLQVGFNIFRKAPAPFIIYSILSLFVFSNPFSGILLGGPIIAGYYIVAQKISKNLPIELSDFFKSFDRFVPLMVLNLLITLVVFLGLLLLIIPGLYLAISYLFAPIFVWYYGVEPSEAMSLSRKTISGNFGQIMLLCLILAGINLLGLLAFGVGIFLTLPFTHCVIYATFVDILEAPI